MQHPWPPSLPPLLAHGRDWGVIDKPAGLAVHPGPRTQDCLEARLAAAGVAAQPVHRLDRDTSGCLLLATGKAALRRLQAAFAARTVEKLYWAILVNPPAADRGRVEAALAKISSKERGWRMVADPSGKPAATAWEVLARRDGLALVALRPETGRTHQLRVHATLIGERAHIAGDPVYGLPVEGGMALHARALAFPGPGGETIRVEAPLPERFAASGFAHGDGSVSPVPT